MHLVQTVLEEIIENLDKRRLEITNLRRILLHYVGKPLESTALRMAIPLLYANWEGYVREVCQLYLEFIEASGIRLRELKSDLLGYLWTPNLKRLTGGLNFEKKKAIAELALNRMEDPVLFSDSERTISTKSNLNFDVLMDIAAHLCLDPNSFLPWKHRLNALVNLRNNIAHGSIPTTLNYDLFEEHASTLINLMEGFETILLHALEDRHFCTKEE
jgi:hypothetical protein